MYKAVVFDATAIHIISQTGAITSDWLDGFEIAENSKVISKRVVGDIVYLISNRASESSRLLVIAIGDGGMFTEIEKDHRAEAFVRALRAGLSQFEPSVDIPSSWKSFHHGCKKSFQSNSYGSGVRARLFMDCNPRATNHVYVYALDTEQRKIEEIPVERGVFDLAISSYPGAISAKPVVASKAAAEVVFQLELNERLASELTGGFTLKEWYDNKLTANQREFVDIPLDRSVRLRGPAGTGKTLALIIKCLQHLYEAVDSDKKCRIAFLTHSMATVEIVRSMMADLDERGLLYTTHAEQLLVVTTLQELANKAMAYDLHDLSPISNDGLEGRQLQMLLLGEVVDEFRSSDWIAYRDRCTEPLVKYLEAESDTRVAKYFAWEIMNEFACVLDAEGMRNVARKKKRYLNRKRAKWMMRLETQAEREVVFELYERFRARLKTEKVIGIDQMISDYLGYLDSFRWDTIREREGYDLVFVDELHLFNRQERMVFQFLMRDSHGTPKVMMAYDAKQSPRDTFVGAGMADNKKFNYWRDAGLGDVEKIELLEVFRYTPEIARVLAFIDQTFPGVDFDEEWPDYQGSSQIDNGPTPLCVEANNTKELYNLAFPRAAKIVKKKGRGKNVALLCVDDELFQTYLKAGNYRRKFIAITSRDELPNIRYAGKRFIFSKPEYVAGLQFEAVLLIEVNGDISSQKDDEEVEVGVRRRFVSQVYLGASRAETDLEIYGVKERGGLSDILKHAQDEGALRTVTANQLASL